MASVMVKWTKVASLTRVAVVGDSVLTVWYSWPWWTWVVRDSEGITLDTCVSKTEAQAKAEALKTVDRLAS